MALAAMFATIYACEGDASYRTACAQVPLEGSLREAHERLGAAGARYGGYIDGEHRYVRDVSACAITLDDEGAVIRVRYLEPPAWRAP